jgi:hypothetical protein
MKLGSAVVEYCGPSKGEEPSTTLAWPGWKQPDIPVEVDTARLETSRFKNGFAICLLLYYLSSEFKSTFTSVSIFSVCCYSSVSISVGPSF